MAGGIYVNKCIRSNGWVFKDGDEVILSLYGTGGVAEGCFNMYWSKVE